MMLCAKQTRPEALRLHCRESRLLSNRWKYSLAVQRVVAGCEGTTPNGLDSAPQDVLDLAGPCLPARLAWTCLLPFVFARCGRGNRYLRGVRVRFNGLSAVRGPRGRFLGWSALIRIQTA